MFGRIAHFMYRRRWYVVSAWVVVLVVAAVLALQVNSVLGPGNFTQKGSESATAATIIDSKFHQNDLKVTIVTLRDPSAAVGTPALARVTDTIVRRIRADAGLKVSYLDNPLTSNNRQLIGKDGHSLAILLSSNLDEPSIEGQIDHLRAIVRMPGIVTHVTGTPALNHDYAVSTKNDLTTSESITVPILILILLFVFGTLSAAALPLVLAGLSIMLSLALVYWFGHYLDTSIYVTNVVTALGLGVGIDYSLFITYRFREELRACDDDVETALVRTMMTTGRAVFFSGLTVAIGLSALILTGVSFMASMGLGGMLVPTTALLVAMTLLPALLGMMGTKVNTPVLRTTLEKLTHNAAWLGRFPRRNLFPADGGMWHRWAMTVMRRPWITGGIALAVLLGLTYPVTQLSIAFGGLKNAPKGMDSVQGSLTMQRVFPSQPDPAQVVIQHHVSGNLLQPSELASLRSLQRRFAADPEALHVVGPADFVPASGASTAAQRRQLLGRYVAPDLQTAIITVTSRHDVGTRQSDQMVRRFRTITKSFTAGPMRGDAIYVGGAQASYDDFNDALYAHFGLIIAIVLLLTYGFLFWAFRSVFLPFKAVLLNLLSIGAAYGMLELVFQQGIGSSLLGFSPEGGVAGWVPIFLFAFLFGLSMDYEVFLLSRIREGWLGTRSNRGSVAFGLERTGRLITSAAAVMVVAFSAFMMGSQLQLKQLGFGLVASITVDATIIRLVLVPSIMRLMGRINWWVPGFLQEFASRGAGMGEEAAPKLEEPEAASA
jgi:RND superfamily putative drug exporter